MPISWQVYQAGVVPQLVREGRQTRSDAGWQDIYWNKGY